MHSDGRCIMKNKLAMIVMATMIGVSMTACSSGSSSDASTEITVIEEPIPDSTSEAAAEASTMTADAAMSDTSASDPSIADSAQATTVTGKAGDGCAMHTMEIITDAGDDLYIAIDDNTDTSGTTGIVVGNSYSVTYTTDAAGNMTAVSIADAQ